MSLPTEFDFAVIKFGDGGSPSETFAISCGKHDVSLNFAAQSIDRYVRDCAKPGEIPFRKAKATGKSLDVTATSTTTSRSSFTPMTAPTPALCWAPSPAICWSTPSTSAHRTKAPRTPK